MVPLYFVMIVTFDRHVGIENKLFSLAKFPIVFPRCDAAAIVLCGFLCSIFFLQLLFDAMAECKQQSTTGKTATTVTNNADYLFSSSDESKRENCIHIICILFIM